MLKSDRAETGIGIVFALEKSLYVMEVQHISCHEPFQLLPMRRDRLIILLSELDLIALLDSEQQDVELPGLSENLVAEPKR